MSVPPNRLGGQMAFLLEIDKLKTVRRRTPQADNSTCALAMNTAA